eukprot:GHVH01012138.1.p1 GENE.GHVH01012138.1~~GHVH01012138.1.p1  ORF type:complete len:375 (+),score=43.72 GHVH01012138.1:25-1125(+)
MAGPRQDLAATQIPRNRSANGGSSNNRRPTAPRIGRNARCSNCPDSLVIIDNKNGNQICNACGIILESSIISQEQEWRNFSNTEESSTDRSRVGGPNDAWMKDTTGSTSMIGAQGNFKRMAVLQDMSTAACGTDRQLRSAFMNLKAIQEFFSFKESTVEHAREVVKDMEAVGCLKNRSGTLYMLAVFYLVLREEKVVKTLKDFIAFDSTYSERELGKAINRLKKLLAQRKRLVSTGASCSELVPRFGTALGLSASLSSLATTICAKAEDMSTAQHKPSALAAAALLWTITLCGIVTIQPADVAMAARAGLTTVMITLKEITKLHSLIITLDLEKEIENIKTTPATKQPVASATSIPGSTSMAFPEI